MLTEAGVPKGVVSIIAAGRETGEHLVRHPGVDKVAFTGSTAAGRAIGAICGEQLKRCTLELGGKSAAIILDDADLASTMGWLKMASLMNNGQACVAQTRILASRSRYDEVVGALTETVRSMPVGDPADPANEIGPLVAERQRERVENYIRIGQDEGAKVALGGSGRPYDRGWYVTPTVFAGVSNDMRIAREEIFGPVLTVIPFEDEADALRIANDSDYGLAGTVWTADTDHGMDIARQVRTGTYGVNTYMIESSSPFGGYKSSGVGREPGVPGVPGRAWAPTWSTSRSPAWGELATPSRDELATQHGDLDALATRVGAATARPPYGGQLDTTATCVTATAALAPLVVRQIQRAHRVSKIVRSSFRDSSTGIAAPLIRSQRSSYSRTVAASVMT
jgi:acyl-CoA reductase-like NAD-dependent aldehyde dehydrogenase